jgi:hypothetical protein
MNVGRNLKYDFERAGNSSAPEIGGSSADGEGARETGAGLPGAQNYYAGFAGPKSCFGHWLDMTGQKTLK